MNSIIKVHRQKGMNRACELTEGKILLNIDLTDEGSPARIVDSMWEAGNKKSFAPCKSVRWGFNRRTYITINETPLSFPAGNQSCPEGLATHRKRVLRSQQRCWHEA